MIFDLGLIAFDGLRCASELYEFNDFTFLQGVAPGLDKRALRGSRKAPLFGAHYNSLEWFKTYFFKKYARRENSWF